MPYFYIKKIKSNYKTFLEKEGVLRKNTYNLSPLYIYTSDKIKKGNFLLSYIIDREKEDMKKNIDKNKEYNIIVIFSHNNIDSKENSEFSYKIKSKINPIDLTNNIFNILPDGIKTLPSENKKD